MNDKETDVQEVSGSADVKDSLSKRDIEIFNETLRKNLGRGKD